MGTLQSFSCSCDSRPIRKPLAGVCPIDDAERWSRRSRDTAAILLLVLQRRVLLPQPCANLFLRFLLEPTPSLATWSDSVCLLESGRSAACYESCRSQGSLVFTAQPMVVTPEGRYSELSVSALAGQTFWGLMLGLQRPGIILGVTATQPGSWKHVPYNISVVPQCVWGLPRCSTPPFKIGTRIGYLVSRSGDLALFVNDEKVGEAPAPRGLADCPELWLVVDLSHDVEQVQIRDAEPPTERSPLHRFVFQHATSARSFLLTPGSQQQIWWFRLASIIGFCSLCLSSVFAFYVPKVRQ